MRMRARATAMLNRVPPNVGFLIPDGEAGTREALKHMRDLVRQGRLDLANRHLANTVVRGVPPKDFEGEIAALLNFVRQAFRYSLDPNTVEVSASAQETLALGYGDCDDLCVALATWCECLGHPAMFVAVGFGPIGEYTHVLILVSPGGADQWIAAEPTENVPLGWYPPGVTCEMIAPID